MAKEDFEKAVIKRLDTIISLMVDVALGSETPKPADKIRRLADTGLPIADIGKIVGKKSNYISVVLTRGTKKGKNKKGF